jgi:hypothetical protein
MNKSIIYLNSLTKLSKPTMLSYVTIAHVPNDANKVAYHLEKCGLFKTKAICVFPEFNGKTQFYRAYVEVAEWCDREMAYNMIQRIKNPRVEARLVYNDDDWWSVEETDEAEIQYTQSSAFDQWTIRFQDAEDSDEDDDDDARIKLDNAFQQVAMMV